MGKKKAKGNVGKQVAKAVKTAIKVVAKSKSKTAKKGSLGRTLSRYAGTAVGGLVGLPGAGATAGEMFANIMGMGKYRVKHNVFSSSPDSVPVFHAGADGTVILEHRELVTDVRGSANFTSMVFDIDPTLSASFPYLANVAINFEQYEFLGLVYVYKPTSGEVTGANTALGTVCFATEYDVARALFQTKSEMESYEFSTSTKPDEGMFHPVECNPKYDVLNSRYGAGVARQFKFPTSGSGMLESSVTGVAANLTKVGRLQVGTVGMQNANTVGELWVTYRIKLMKPRQPIPGVYGGVVDATCAPTATVTTGGTAFGGLVNLNMLSRSTNNLQGVTFDSNGTTVFFNNLPPRTTFLLVLNYRGTGTLNVGARTFSNLTIAGNWFPDISTGLGTAELLCGDGTANVSYMASFYTTDTSFTNVGSLIFANPTVSAGGSFVWDLKIVTVPTFTALSGLSSPMSDLAQKLDYLEKKLQALQIEDVSDDEIYRETQAVPVAAPLLLRAKGKMA